MIDKDLFIEKVNSAFTDNAIDTDAIQMEKYMRNQFKFFGLKSPLRKELQRNIIKEFGYPPINDIEYIALNFWNSDERELQYFAMELLQKNINKFDSNIIDFLETLIQKKSWWDTIDFIAPNLVGKLFINDKESQNKYITKWINSDNFWLKRSAIISQLRYKEQTDFNLLKELIFITKDDDEFFIRKAIGWALREHSKRFPQEVKQFIKATDLKPLSTKEGLKYINKNNL